MSDNEITASVKDFVFQYIDSVEQLEILFLLSADPAKHWTPKELHTSLRSNLNSVEKRLAILIWYKLIDKNEGAYSFKPEDSQLIKTVEDLNKCYKIHRHKILEMIFSPMKKSRDFAEAFVLSSSKENKGDPHG